MFAYIGQVYGQTDTTVYKNLKTKKFYSVQMRSETGAGKDIYEVNGKRVSKRTYKKYNSSWENMVNCCPCILKTYDEDDNLLREGVACTDCRVGWFKSYYKNGQIEMAGSYKENPTGDWNGIWSRGYCNVRHGEWMYFSEKGDTLYSEFWENGNFVKQVPEQAESEIWEVKIRFNGQEIDSLAIPIANVGSLSIEPQFKNSNTTSNLTITFEVGAIGYRRNKKDFTLESFKKIDVNAMLEEVGIPKDKEANFTLNIYNNGKAIERIGIKVKR